MADITAPEKKKSNLGRKILLIFLAILIGVFGILYLVFNFTYSEGTRAGVLIKFSKRGFIFKTYEGDLNLGGMGNLPNTAQVNQIWHFSVEDDAFAETLHGYEGKPVSLHYKEKVKNFWWQGETKYMVDGVQEVK